MKANYDVRIRYPGDPDRDLNDRPRAGPPLPDTPAETVHPADAELARIPGYD